MLILNVMLLIIIAGLLHLSPRRIYRVFVPPPRLKLNHTIAVNMDYDVKKFDGLLTDIMKSKIISGMPPNGLFRLPGVPADRLWLHHEVEAKRLTKEAYNSMVAMTRVVGGEYMTVGAYGCLLSHVKAWERIIQVQETTFVIEDDVRLLIGPQKNSDLDDFDTFLSRAFPTLPSNWGLIYLGNVIGDAIKPSLHHYNQYFWQMSGDHYGTYAYIISPKAAEILLRNVYPSQFQVDSMMIKIAREKNLSVFMTKKRLVTVDNKPGRDSRTQRYRLPEQKIPRIFHFIWLGSKKMPPQLRKNIKQWKKLHPNWSIKMWTDSNRPVLLNQYRFDQAKFPAQKADMLRYEIIEKYGGVYVDLDFEPLKNIEPLLAGLDAFVAYERPEWVCNGIFGAIPQHILSHQLVQNLDQNIKRFERGTVNQQTGPHYMTWTVEALNLTTAHHFQAFATHIFFPYVFGQAKPKPPYSPLSYAVHHFDGNPDKFKNPHKE